MIAVALATLAVIAAAACALYGARIRYDEFLHDYPRRDPFRREQEKEGLLWITSGAAVLLMATAVWWVTHH